MDNINSIKEYVKRKKKESFILWLLLTIFCFTNIIINIDLYKKVIFNSYDNLIKLEDLKKEYKYITVDLTKAKKENYLIEIDNKKAHIYTLNIEGENVLVVINDNTLVTDKVLVEKYDDDSLSNDIRLKFPNKEYQDITLSNINYNKDRKVDTYKFYTLLAFFILGLLFAIKNFIQVLRPTKCKMYKKLISKL